MMSVAAGLRALSFFLSGYGIAHVGTVGSKIRIRLATASIDASQEILDGLGKNPMGRVDVLS